MKNQRKLRDDMYNHIAAQMPKDTYTYTIAQLEAKGWDFLPDFPEYPYTDNGEKQFLLDHGNDIVELLIRKDEVLYLLEGWEEGEPSGDKLKAIEDIIDLEELGLISLPAAIAVEYLEARRQTRRKE